MKTRAVTLRNRIPLARLMLPRRRLSGRPFRLALRALSPASPRKSERIARRVNTRQSFCTLPGAGDSKRSIETVGTASSRRKKETPREIFKAGEIL